LSRGKTTRTSLLNLSLRLLHKFRLFGIQVGKSEICLIGPVNREGMAALVAIMKVRKHCSSDIMEFFYELVIVVS
jgi:hypothetical protein